MRALPCTCLPLALPLPLLTFTLASASAVLQDGDTIRIDAETRKMDILNIDDAELARR